LTLPDSSFPLAQCTGLEVGEPFGFIAKFGVANVCFKSEDILDKVHDLEKTTLEGSRDVFMHEESPNLGFDDIILSNRLDHSHASPMCSPPSIFLEYSLDVPIDNSMICDTNDNLGYVDKMFSMLGGNVDDYASLGYFRGYDLSIDPYCLCLGDLPKKITWAILNPSYDFSKAIDKVKRMLNVFGTILVITSYLLFSKLWSQEFDKLLRALMMSDLKG